MSTTRIKICGITRAADAIAAARAGADAIGMVFYPAAKRCISLERAKEILGVLPPFVTPVGLFVDQPIDEIRSIVEPLKLRHLQLHGHEAAAMIAQLSAFAILKAIRVEKETFPAVLSKWQQDIAQYQLSNLRGLILETAGSFPGGTGASNDWEAIRSAKNQGLFEGLPPIIVAGGLTAGNVAEVIRSIHPWAVDVSSGVEETFGIKSESKTRAFIDAVREAI